MTQLNITTMQDILDALDQNPNLQREFHRHLAAVIRNDDDLREELRREILTEELLRLPSRITRLEADVDQIKQDIGSLKEGQTRMSGQIANLEEGQTRMSGQIANLEEGQTRMSGQIANLEEGQTRMSGQIANLEEGQTRMSGQIANLEEGQTRMSGQIANLTGSDYEGKAIEQSRRLVRRHLQMESATLVYASRKNGAEFESEVLLPAIRQDRINRSEADQLEEADAIIRCHDENGNVICAVVEISVTIQDNDRNRAAARAKLFNLATGLPTRPFVVGQEQEATGSEAPDVTFLQYQP